MCVKDIVMDLRQFQFVHCPVEQPPTILTGHLHYDAIMRLLGTGTVDVVPMPTSPVKSLVAICDENGLSKGLKPNRFHLVGCLLFVKRHGQHLRSLTDAEARAVKTWLESPATLPTLIHIPARAAVSADEYERNGGEFDPQLHFTGELKGDEVQFINQLLAKHTTGLIAYHMYSPFPNTYSIELQYQNREAMLACREEYFKWAECQPSNEIQEDDEDDGDASEDD